jgi:hypothetical protein
MSIVMLMAIVMAVSGVIGYRRGLWPALLNLGALAAGFFVVEKDPQRLVDSMNALFVGLALVVRTGFGEVSAGDVEAAAQRLQSASAPFTGEHSGLALAIVMVAAAVVGWLLGVRIKTKPSVVGAAVGIANGYVLAAAFVPWLTSMSADALPVPFIRKGQGLPAVSTSGLGAAASKLALPPVLEWLSFEGGLPLVILVGVLAIFAVWRMKPRRSPNSRDAH